MFLPEEMTEADRVAILSQKIAVGLIILFPFVIIGGIWIKVRAEPKETMAFDKSVSGKALDKIMETEDEFSRETEQEIEDQSVRQPESSARKNLEYNKQFSGTVEPQSPAPLLRESHPGAGKPSSAPSLHL